jgi:hypothetical protein
MPPFGNELTQRSYGAFDWIAEKVGPMCAVSYLLVARKRVRRIIPLGRKWRREARAEGIGLANPTARSAESDIVTRLVPIDSRDRHSGPGKGGKD